MLMYCNVIFSAFACRHNKRRHVGNFVQYLLLFFLKFSKAFFQRFYFILISR